jgi:hypothetical protein
MKVYVAVYNGIDEDTGGNVYDTKNVVGVLSSEEEVQKFKDDSKYWYWHDIDFLEFELDSHNWWGRKTDADRSEDEKRKKKGLPVTISIVKVRNGPYRII